MSNIPLTIVTFTGPSASLTDGADEEAFVVVAAAEGDFGDFGAAEGEGFGGEVVEGEGAVAVGDLVEAGFGL